MAPTAGHAVQQQLDADPRSLFDTTFVVLDLETTGLTPATDRITEVGAVKVRGGEVLGELQTLVHPGRSLAPAITAITGITDGMLAGAPTIATVLPTVLEFLRGSVLVAHNARFDVGFLDAELTRERYPRLGNDVLDTARLARRLVREDVRDLRLATLARYFRARTTPTHRALMDARATVDVLHGLLERAGTIGASTVEDVLDLQHSSSEPAFRRRGLIDGAPRAPGVYRFRDAEGRVLYVGKATQLRDRLRTYFGQDDRRQVDAMLRETASVDWTLTPTLVAAEVLELRELAARRPRYNRAGTHPRPAAWLRWTDEAFPRLSVARSPGAAPGRALGPLPSRRVATELVEAVQEVAAVRRCTFRIRAEQDHPTCVLKELARCSSPCDGTADAATYAADVVPVARLVAGVADEVLDRLTARMASLASDERYEEAARLRGRLHVVGTTVDQLRRTRALAEVAMLELALPTADHVDAVRVRHGRLVASVRAPVRPGTGDRTGARATALADAIAMLASTEDDPVASTDGDHPAARAELALLTRWAERAGTVLLDVDGTWASPVAGGASAAAVAAQARETARLARADRQLLRGEKVRRRHTEDTHRAA